PDAVREAIHAVDPDQPVPHPMPLRRVLVEGVGEPRFLMAIFVLFGTSALALAAAGVFGVASSTAAERSHEIGVRIALGAPQVHLFRVVVGDGLLVATSGVLLGAAVALSASRSLASILHGV